MRTLCILLGALAVGLLVPACSDEVEDSIESRCNTRCELNQDKCASQKTQCLSMCKQKGAQVEATTGRKECALCIASTATYYMDSTGCYPPQFGNTTDAACKSKCFNPDGGISY